MNMPPPLTIEGLTKHYGNTAVVDGLSLEVQPGRCHGLLDPNGAGKTTTLRLALGLTRPDAGEIRLLGHPVPGEAAVARARVAAHGGQSRQGVRPHVPGSPLGR